jgi:hypothetical protein
MLDTSTPTPSNVYKAALHYIRRAIDNLLSTHLRVASYFLQSRTLVSGRSFKKECLVYHALYLPCFAIFKIPKFSSHLPRSYGNCSLRNSEVQFERAYSNVTPIHGMVNCGFRKTKIGIIAHTAILPNLDFGLHYVNYGSLQFDTPQT